MTSLTAPIETDERVEAAARLIAAGQVTPAEAMLREILSREPAHPDALNTFASLFLARNDATRAFEILGPACTAYPDHARLLANLGLAHFMLGRPGDAVICLERAVARAPHEIPFRLALAQYRAAAGDAGAAMADLEAILRDAPDTLGALAQLGALAIASGAWARGEEVLRRAATLDPGQVDVLANLGTLCAMTGRLEEAAVLAERAHLRAPLDLARLVQWAGAKAMLGEFDRAAELLKRVLVTAPDHTGATALFARLAVARGAVESGISTMSQLVRRRPQNAEAIVALARLLRFAGRHAQAMAFVDQALNVEADNSQALALRHELRLTLGQFAEAWGGPVEVGEGRPRVIALAHGTSLVEAILYGRFAADLGQEGLALMTEAESAAAAFLRRLPCVAPWRDRADDELAIRLEGLPLYLGSRREDVGRPRPLPQPDPARYGRWREAFASLRRPIIAIDWDPYRPGLLLGDIAPIILEAGTPVSFATGAYRHQLRAWRQVIDAGVHIQSVDDLLAAMACVDIFVGVDGGPLHVAGALRRPGLALAAAGHAWWLSAEGDHLLWHPSLRRMLQSNPGRWDDVLAALPGAVTRALGEHEGPNA